MRKELFTDGWKGSKDDLFCENLNRLINPEGKSKLVTQQELADIMGCSRVTVRKYLSGESFPISSELRAIADHFNISVDYLLGLSPNPKLDDGLYSSFLNIITTENKAIYDEILLYFEQLCRYTSISDFDYIGIAINPNFPNSEEEGAFVVLDKCEKDYFSNPLLPRPEEVAVNLAHLIGEDITKILISFIKDEPQEKHSSVMSEINAIKNHNSHKQDGKETNNV